MTDQTAVDIFSDFALDEEKQKGGVWVPYKGDVEFLIAHSGNRNFRKRIQHEYKKNARLLDSDTDAAEEKSNAIMVQTLADTVLLGWKGKVAHKGQVLEYSKANARLLLAMPMFREWISKQAEDQATYKAVQDEADLKN